MDENKEKNTRQKNKSTKEGKTLEGLLQGRCGRILESINHLQLGSKYLIQIIDSKPYIYVLTT